MHEHTLESLLLGRRTKRNFALCFRSFLEVFANGFLQEISFLTGGNDRFKER